MEFWAQQRVGGWLPRGSATLVGGPKAKPQQEDRGRFAQIEPSLGSVSNYLPARRGFSAGAIKDRLNKSSVFHSHLTASEIIQ